jgi:NADPH:quinone reductase-like Zn-dependent oxidoreductase
MKQVQLVRYGSPETTCECIDSAPLPPPAAGQINVAIRASAINPADLLIFEDRYPGPDVLPAFVGIEGAGEVIAVGDGVDEYQVGDHVLSLGRANWSEQVCGDTTQFVKIPTELDWNNAAQLKANPPSAFLMLENYVELNAGDWVMQNAANSAVGRHVIQGCKARGLHSINVVRRAELIPELEALGADLVVVDSDNLAAEVREKTGADANIRLGIDAIAGDAMLRMADTLSNGAKVVNYGFLSGQPCMLTPTHTIVRGMSLYGFWLVGFFQTATRAQVVDMYTRVAQQFLDQELHVPVEAEYPITDIASALEHANREGRNGKIVLRM